MRFDGTLTSWNEAKGFGFLAPHQGGQDIFVHISALPRGTGAGSVGQVFSFEVELNAQGKKRATRVQPVTPVPARTMPGARPFEPTRRTPARRRPGLVVLALVVAVGVAGAAWLQGTHRSGALGVSMPLDLTTNERAPSVPQAATPFRCDGRMHCSQMSSCAEARFFLANCPGVLMDGNRDGTPCEQQWCTSPLAP